ncbi:MAG TPA: hypothetical protein PLY99_05720, partial [Acidovorax temperans]|nr:hypothetical protein [Acidovorax temperans]
MRDMDGCKGSRWVLRCAEQKSTLGYSVLWLGSGLRWKAIEKMLRSSPNRRRWPWAWLALWVLWLQAVLGAPLPEAQKQALQLRAPGSVHPGGR